MEAEKNYLVIGYHRGKVIAKDEWNSLYYVECEEEMAPIGKAERTDRERT